VCVCLCVCVCVCVCASVVEELQQSFDRFHVSMVIAISNLGQP